MSENPPTPSPDAPAPAEPETPSALDQAPLSEYVARRGKGETPATPPPAPAPPDEPDDDLPPEEAPPPKPGEKKPPVPPGKPKSRFEERLGTLTRQRHDAERALEAERARVLQLQEELQQVRPPRAPDRQPELPAERTGPIWEEYQAAGKTWEDFQSAQMRFVAAEVLREERQRVSYEQQQRQISEQMAGFGERTEAAKTKYPDYDEIVINNDRVQLSPVMQDIARRSPHGPDLMYWLGTHEAEANKLGQITAGYPQAAYPLVEQHLLLLSGHRANGAESAGAKKAVAVSQAPAPLSPVGGGSTTEPVALDAVPLGEFIKRRQADLQKKRGR